MIIFALPEARVRLRTGLNLFGATAKLILVGVLMLGVNAGGAYGFAYSVLPGVELVLKADALALLFVTLSALLLLVTTLYAIGYLEGAPHRSRFFGFFSLCVTATMGIAMAGNLFTFFLFYELLTLSTYPLVVHRGTPASMRGGTIYLAYTLAGGALLLTGVVWLHGFVGAADFTHGCMLSGLGPEYVAQLQIVFLLLICGVGVKAAIVPLHGWLPQAMVAPAPVSALLHAVAVVKAGAFGVVRIVYEVYGAESAGMAWAVWVLWTSSLLNAAYFLPILWRAWFKPSSTAWPDEHIPTQGHRETAWLLLVPQLLTASAALILGFAGEASWSPLVWATLIADREYLQWTP